MDIRPELMPPILDEAKVARLAELADRLDGAAPGQWEEDLAEFHRRAGEAIPFEHFQGVSGGSRHEDWVRRLLYRQFVVHVPDPSGEEMVEIISRVMTCAADHDYFLELFIEKCKHPSKSDLIFWPDLVPELPQDREPTAEEIADLALRSSGRGL